MCKNKNMKSWLHDVYNNELQDEYLLHLTVGAMMVEKLRELVFKQTGFRCSAGISNNKVGRYELLFVINCKLLDGRHL